MKTWDLSQIILFACVIAPFATGQVHVHFGVEAGVPLTDTLSSSRFSSTSPVSSSIDQYNSVTKRLLIGPAFRVDLQRGLGLEFDALYQRVNYDHLIVFSAPTATPAGIFNQSFEQTTANRWQFPLLVQYTWTLSKARAFVEAGPSISRMTNGRSTISTTTSSLPLHPSSTFSVTGQGGTLAGVTAGAGVDLPLFGLHLRPEFRYSHWFSPTTASSGGIVGAISIYPIISTIPVAVPPSFRTNQNEASFLLGLTF